MKNPEAFSDEIFGFHAQQAVEKSLKAWLSLIGEKYPRIHDLEELFELLKSNNQAVPPGFFESVSLTDFAVQLRYDALMDFEEDLDRAAITTQVREIVAHVGTLVKGYPGG